MNSEILYRFLFYFLFGRVSLLMSLYSPLLS